MSRDAIAGAETSHVLEVARRFAYHWRTRNAVFDSDVAKFPRNYTEARDEQLQFAALLSDLSSELVDAVEALDVAVAAHTLQRGIPPHLGHLGTPGVPCPLCPPAQGQIVVEGPG